jgi:hypothetical protein
LRTLSAVCDLHGSKVLALESLERIARDSLENIAICATAFLDDIFRKFKWRTTFLSTPELDRSIADDLLVSPRRFLADDNLVSFDEPATVTRKPLIAETNLPGESMPTSALKSIISIPLDRAKSYPLSYTSQARPMTPEKVGS